MLQHSNRRSHLALIPEHVGEIKPRRTLNIQTEFCARLSKLGQGDCALQRCLKNTMIPRDLQ